MTDDTLFELKEKRAAALRAAAAARESLEELEAARRSVALAPGPKGVSRTYG